jgi:ParB-like chromosome segregation protein Spo0J
LTAPRRSAIVFNKTDEYDVKKSMEKIGYFYPVLRSADGRVIDGMHRKNADKNWPEHVVNITSDMILVAQIVANMQRRKISKKEKSDLLKNLAKATHWTTAQIAENTGMSLSWVRKYLPPAYKDKRMTKLANKKHEISRTVMCVEELPICPNCESTLVLFLVCRDCGYMAEADESERHRLEGS